MCKNQLILYIVQHIRNYFTQKCNMFKNELDKFWENQDKILMLNCKEMETEVERDV